MATFSIVASCGLVEDNPTFRRQQALLKRRRLPLNTAQQHTRQNRHSVKEYFMRLLLEN
jgi:hypothetical protein